MRPPKSNKVPKILPPHLFLLTLVLMLVLGRIETGTIEANLWGLPFSVFGVWLAAREKNRFVAAGTSFYPGEDAHKLMTDGAYRFSRNPMYLGMALALLGLWPISGGLLPLIPFFLFIAAIQIFFIRKEEANLEALFGDDYRAYKDRVRRWF